jgi:hypothetical protein
MPGLVCCVGYFPRRCEGGHVTHRGAVNSQSIQRVYVRFRETSVSIPTGEDGVCVSLVPKQAPPRCARSRYVVRPAYCPPTFHLPLRAFSPGALLPCVQWPRRTSSSESVGEAGQSQFPSSSALLRSRVITASHRVTDRREANRGPEGAVPQTCATSSQGSADALVVGTSYR